MQPFLEKTEPHRQDKENGRTPRQPAHVVWKQPQPRILMANRKKTPSLSQVAFSLWWLRFSDPHFTATPIATTTFQQPQQRGADAIFFFVFVPCFFCHGPGEAKGNAWKHRKYHITLSNQECSARTTLAGNLFFSVQVKGH